MTMADFTILIYGSPERVNALIVEEQMRTADDLFDADYVLSRADWRLPPKYADPSMHILRISSRLGQYPPAVQGLVWEVTMPMLNRLAEREHQFEPGDAVQFEALRLSPAKVDCVEWRSMNHYRMLEWSKPVFRGAKDRTRPFT